MAIIKFYEVYNLMYFLHISICTLSTFEQRDTLIKYDECTFINEYGNFLAIGRNFIVIEILRRSKESAKNINISELRTHYLNIDGVTIPNFIAEFQLETKDSIMFLCVYFRCLDGRNYLRVATATSFLHGDIGSIQINNYKMKVFNCGDEDSEVKLTKKYEDGLCFIIIRHKSFLNQEMTPESNIIYIFRECVKQGKKFNAIFDHENKELKVEVNELELGDDNFMLLIYPFYFSSVFKMSKLVTDI